MTKTSAFRRSVTLAIALAAGMATTAAVPFDRRIVDTVEPGNASSEALHGYAGEDVTFGESGGKPYRQTRSWMHYALKTFEDTPVTIACTFVGIDSLARSYDLVVEDSIVASRTYIPKPNAPTVVEFVVPFSLTKGKASVAIVIRARGGPAPAVQLIRTIQDHYELADSDPALAPKSSRVATG